VKDSTKVYFQLVDVDKLSEYFKFVHVAIKPYDEEGKLVRTLVLHFDAPTRSVTLDEGVCHVDARIHYFTKAVVKPVSGEICIAVWGEEA